MHKKRTKRISKYLEPQLIGAAALDTLCKTLTPLIVDDKWDQVQWQIMISMCMFDDVYETLLESDIAHHIVRLGNLRPDCEATLRLFAEAAAEAERTGGKPIEFVKLDDGLV